MLASRSIIEGGEGSEPGSGGVSGAVVGKSVPEAPGSLFEQAEPSFNE